MRSSSIAVRTLIDSGVRLSWPESIALVQSIAEIASRPAERGSTLNQAAQSALDRVMVSIDGAVSVGADGPVAISVSDLATLLGKLLPDGLADHSWRGPTALYFTVARGLGLADAPPFPSVEQFSHALARFETRPRAELLRQVVERYRAVVTARSAGPTRAATPRVERRSSGLPPDTLRRLLRDADVDIFATRAARVKKARVARRQGPSVETLRRLLREADRTIYELREQAAGARPRARRRSSAMWNRAARLAGPVLRHTGGARFWSGHRTLAALGIVLIAAGAAAQRRPLGEMLRVIATRVEMSTARPAVAADSLPPRAVPQPRDAARPVPAAPVASANGSGALMVARPAGGRRPVSADDRLATTVVPEAREGAMEPLPTLPAPTGRLVEALDTAQRPVFSPSFAVAGSAVFDAAARPVVVTADVESGQGSPATRDPAATGFVRVLSIANDRGHNYHPRLSPDGTTIAFDSDRDGIRGVYLASHDGRNVRRVSGSEYAAFPAWSPDGAHLAFVKSEPGQPTVWNVWSLDVRSGSMARLTWYRDGQPWGVSWFPDGRRICYAHEDEIDVLDTISGEAHAFASPRADRLIRMPTVSPDGRKVLFELDNDGAWLLDLADGSMHELLADPEANNFAWSPDGQRIVFQTRRGGDWSSWSLQ